MTNPRLMRRVQVVGLASVLCVITSVNCASAQISQFQWPPVPIVVTEHTHNDEEVNLIPHPVLPPEAKPPGSDPLLSIAAPSHEVKGTLAYFANAWDGKGTSPYSVLVLRSLGSSRLLPVQHLGSPGVNLSANIATYGFHQGEYNVGSLQLSPDGQVIAYEEVKPMSQYGGSVLYEWDMKAKRVRQLTSSNIAFLDFFWSPDSQSIAYVSGGLRTGKPAQLNIVDRRTLQSQTVVLPEGVSLLLSSPVPQQSSSIMPISWASPTSVLLTGLPTTGAGKGILVRPNIYEATSGKVRLVVPHAYAPSPSPNGRWIACFGWPETGANELKQRPPQVGPNIYLYDRHQDKRIFVRSLTKYGRREAESGSVPPLQSLRWTPDGRRLILTEETYQVKGKAGEGTAVISTLDVPAQPLADATQLAQTLRLLTTLRVTDAVPLPTIHFGPLQVSSEGNHLFMTTLQATGQQGDQTTSQSSLQRINLTNGQVDILARFNNERLRGFDWHEEPK